MCLIGEVPRQTLFLNLNYDTYVEQAIRQFTSNAIRFEAFEDYVVPGRSMNLVKLHGSIDWFHPLPGPHGSWRDAVAAWSISNRSSPDLWEVHGKVSRSDRLRGVENRWMYPVLMAPLTEKTLKDASLPQSHLSWTHEFLETCEKFLIIGTNGFDDDLMELLDESVPPDSFPLTMSWVLTRRQAPSTISPAMSQPFAPQPIWRHRFLRCPKTVSVHFYPVRSSSRSRNTQAVGSAATVQ